jgi:hypothetical protein
VASCWGALRIRQNSFELWIDGTLSARKHCSAAKSNVFVERIWRKILGKDLGGTSMLATKVDWPNARAMIRETIQNNRTAPLLPHEEDLEEDFGEEKYFSAGRKC